METIEYFRDFCIAYEDLFIWDLKEISGKRFPYENNVSLLPKRRQGSN